jgi:hypothetical protein
VHTHASPPVTLRNKEKILLNQAINFNQRDRKYIKNSGKPRSFERWRVYFPGIEKK